MTGDKWFATDPVWLGLVAYHLSAAIHGFRREQPRAVCNPVWVIGLVNHQLSAAIPGFATDPVRDGVASTFSLKKG